MASRFRSIAEDLSQCSDAVFNKTVFLIKAPRDVLPSEIAAQANRAIKLIEWAESTNGIGLSKLYEFYEKASGVDPQNISPNSAVDNNNSSRPSRTVKVTSVWHELGISGVLGGIITTLVFGVQLVGGFQLFELKSFDHFMQQRPKEDVDDRLLIIGADTEDLKKYGDGGRLYDDSLARLLEKLKEHQPSAIGLDIFRSQPVPKNDQKGHERLTNQFKNNPDIFAICYSSLDPKDSVAPPNISQLQVGFNELFYDEFPTQQYDNTVRRYLLSRTENFGEKEIKCKAEDSLALQLARKYLEKQKTTVDVVNESWRFGPTTTFPLKDSSGGYRNLDSLGYQIMINYRQTKPPEK